MALSAKERGLIERNEFKKVPKDQRLSSNDESLFPLTAEEAVRESQRCLKCASPSCRPSCPFSNDIPGFMQAVEDGNLALASKILRETTLFPSVCSRVCPADKMCQSTCIYHKMKKPPVNIAGVELYIALEEQKNNSLELPKITETGKKVAVIGAGPAGCEASYVLRTLGHSVDLYDMYRLPGGLLEFGLPQFRLPRDSVHYELNILNRMGVKFIPNMKLGDNLKLDELKSKYDAVLISIGTDQPAPLQVKNLDAKGVISGIGHLMTYSTMDLPDLRKSEYGKKFIGKRIGIVGAGDTAMDIARSFLRIGAKSVNIIYRRTIEEAPAIKDDIEFTHEEGAEFHFLTNPVEMLVDSNHNVIGVKLEKMKLGEPDASGRRSPVQTGEFFDMELDYLLPSLGFKSEDELMKACGLEIGKKWQLHTDENYMTSVRGVFGAGDVASHGALVSRAGGAGKNAAYSIDKYLKG